MIIRRLDSLWDTAKFLTKKNTRRMYRHMLECQTRYPIHYDPRLAQQLVPKEGALSHVEGVTLYAIARFIQAQDIVELGTYAGHSTNYLAEAVWRNGGFVDTVDNVRYWGWVIRGQSIALRNRLVVHQHKSDAVDWLEGQFNGSFDMIFEDTSHTYADTISLIISAQSKLRKGGILAIHDVAVDKVPTCKVYEAVRDSGLDFKCFTTYPGEQGLAVWVKP